MPGDSGKGCAAIVTTLRGAGAVLDSFIDYHLAIGFAHLFLFFDDPGDPDLSRAAANPAVTAIAHDESLRRAWTRLPQYEEQAAFLEREVMARQILNVQLAMEMARRQGLGWLLNIDADELFYSPGQSAGEYFAALADAPHETVTFPNFEALPEVEDIADFFREVDLFRAPPPAGRPPAPAALQLLTAVPQLTPGLFHYYACGKSAVRLSAPDMRPLGVHNFERPGGAAGAVDRERFILHYPCCGFEAFWTKYATLGRFSDKWFGKYDIAAEIGTFHLEARDVVTGGGRDAALAFYRRRVALKDPVIIEALLRFGILARISQPRRILARERGRNFAVL